VQRVGEAKLCAGVLLPHREKRCITGLEGVGYEGRKGYVLRAKLDIQLLILRGVTQGDSLEAKE